MSTVNRRSYRELSRIDDYMGRFSYLSLRGQVGEATFGSERWMNQDFYRSREWKQVRHHVIARDGGCDMGFPGYEIFGQITIHHMNPITPDEIMHGADSILDPDNLICVTHLTHNAIHYGDANLLPQPIVERRPGDTTLWTPIRRTNV